MANYMLFKSFNVCSESVFQKLRRAASISLLKFTMNLQRLRSEVLEEVFPILSSMWIFSRVVTPLHSVPAEAWRWSETPAGGKNGVFRRNTRTKLLVWTTVSVIHIIYVHIYIYTCMKELMRQEKFNATKSGLPGLLTLLHCSLTRRNMLWILIRS